MRPPRCDVCDKPVDPDVMHLLHETACGRFMEGFCRCDRWGCPKCACCCDRPPSDLVEAIRTAHLAYVASIDLEDAS